MTSHSQDAGAQEAGRLAAGVVVFFPDADLLRNVVAAARSHAGAVFVLINGSADAAVRAELDRSERVVVIDSPWNLGVGEALNILVLNAAWSGFSEMALFDQDSRPEPELLPKLLDVMRSLQERGEAVAVVGPRLIAPEEGCYKSPRYFVRRTPAATPAAQPVHFLPTSGSLISVAAFRAIGPFRSDYFIDGIDVEWCFRAWARGFSCWCATQATMAHTVGEGALRIPGTAWRTPRQRDFRFKTYVRNTLYGLRLGHIPLSWKARQVAYLAVQVAAAVAASDAKVGLLRGIARAAIDGLVGRLGAPEGASLTHKGGRPGR